MARGKGQTNGIPQIFHYPATMCSQQNLSFSKPTKNEKTEELINVIYI